MLQVFYLYVYTYIVLSVCLHLYMYNGTIIRQGRQGSYLGGQEGRKK